MKESVLNMMKETVANHVYQVISDELPPEEWDLAALNAELLPIVPLNKIVLTDAEKSSGRVDDLVARLQEETVALYEQKEKDKNRYRSCTGRNGNCSGHSGGTQRYTALYHNC